MDLASHSGWFSGSSEAVVPGAAEIFKGSEWTSITSTNWKEPSGS